MGQGQVGQEKPCPCSPTCSLGLGTRVNNGVKSVPAPESFWVALLPDTRTLERIRDASRDKERVCGSWRCMSLLYRLTATWNSIGINGGARNLMGINRGGTTIVTSPSQQITKIEFNNIKNSNNILMMRIQ